MKTLTVEVHVKARARESSLTENPDGSISIKTPAIPDKGKANVAVVKKLAEHYGVPQSCVSIVRGHTNSKKVVSIMVS
jgi:uncharacterized protein (TIGR00251 family)